MSLNLEAVLRLTMLLVRKVRLQLFNAFVSRAWSAASVFWGTKRGMPPHLLYLLATSCLKLAAEDVLVSCLDLFPAPHRHVPEHGVWTLHGFLRVGGRL